MGVRVEKEAEVGREDAVNLAALGAHDDLLLVVAEVYGHDARVELGLVGQGPLASCQVHLLDLAVATADEEHVAEDAAADSAVAREGHGSPVELLRDAEDADFAASGAREKHVALREGKGVLPHQARVRQLALRCRQVVLHGADVEGETIDRDATLVARYQCVRRVLRVHRRVHVGPLEDGKGGVGDARVDGLAILGLPDDEGVVLADAGEELVIGRELQFQDLVLDAAQDGEGLLGLHVPQDDGRVGRALEDRALLAGSYDVARVGDGDRGDFHVVPAEELLFVLVQQVLDHQQATDVVDQGVLHRGVEFNRVRVLAREPDGVIHLEHLSLALLGSGLLHRCDVTGRFRALLRAKDA